jgi:hypothetical protein
LWSYSFVQRNVGFRLYFVLVSNYRIYVTWLDTPMTWKYYDMKVYLGKDRECMAQQLTVIYATVTQLSKKIGCGHKLCVDNLFSSPNSMTWKSTTCCGTVSLNR